MQQCRAKSLAHDWPGPPPGFAKFAVALRRAKASRELVRNRCRWPQTYSASDVNDGDDGGNDTEAEDVRTKSEPSDDEEEELWEEEAIASVRNEPSAMMEDDSDLEEYYAMPSRSNKRDQSPFAHWESNN